MFLRITVSLLGLQLALFTVDYYDWCDIVQWPGRSVFAASISVGVVALGAIGRSAWGAALRRPLHSSIPAVLLLCCSVGLQSAWLLAEVARCSKETSGAGALIAAGGRIYYDYQCDVDRWLRLGSPFPGVHGGNPQIPGPVWVRHWLGDKFFAQIVVADSVKVIEDVAGMKHLRVLGLVGTTIGDEQLRHVRSLRGIEALKIRKSRVTDDGLSYLTELPRLWSLIIDNAAITDAGASTLGRFRGLEALALDKVAISDRGMAALGNLIQLKAISVRENRISDAGILHLASLTNLEQVNLSHTCVTNAAAQVLGRMLLMKRLDLSGTRVTDDGICELRQLTHIELLGLDDTSIGDVALQCIGEMSQLRQLYLDGTNVTDEGLKHIGALPELQFVTLVRTQVTREGVTRLRSMSRCSVAWEGLTKKVNDIPDAVGDATER